MPIMNLNMPAAGGQATGGQQTSGANPTGLTKLTTGKAGAGKHAAAGKASASDLFGFLLGQAKKTGSGEEPDQAAGLAGLLALPAMTQPAEPMPEAPGEKAKGAAVDAQPAVLSAKPETADNDLLQHLTKDKGSEDRQAGFAETAAAELTDQTAPTDLSAQKAQTDLTDRATRAGQAGLHPALARLQGKQVADGPSATRPAAPTADPRKDAEQLSQLAGKGQLSVHPQTQQLQEKHPGTDATNPEQDPRFARVLKPQAQTADTQQPALRQPHALHEQAEPATAIATAVTKPTRTEKPAHHASRPDLQIKPELTINHHPEPTLSTVSTNPRPEQLQAQPAAQPADGHIQLASGRQVSEQALLNQVVVKMTGSHNGQSGKATLHLHPAELGQIKLDISIDHDRLKAHMVTQSVQVQEVLEKHLPRLRESLEQHGLHIDSFEVNVDSRQPQSDTWQQQFARQQQPSWDRAQPLASAASVAPLPHPASRPVARSSGMGAISLHV